MAGTAWKHIEYDPEGKIATVVVDDTHLRIFPKFMSKILEEKIGLDVGFFKIRFSEQTNFQTNLKEITSFINNYYNPPQGGRKRKRESLAEVNVQGFFRGGGHQECYGYANLNRLNNNNDPLLANAKDNFVNSISNYQSYDNQVSCCTKALLCGEEELIKHYWEFIKGESLGAHRESRNVEAIMQRASSVRHKYITSHVVQECTLPETVPIQHEQRHSDKSNYLLYGAGIPMKGTTFPITKTFDLSKLQTILDEYPKEVPGLSYPFLYAGTVHASFPWHIEDQALFSINIVHFGAPCVWFFVSPEFYMKFIQWGHHMPLDPSHTSCHNFLGHKYLIASKKCLEELGIPVTTVIQKEKEIVVTYPYAAHSGFKTGFNVQEAANFADEWWIEPGIFAPTCDCFGLYQVHMDLKEIIAVGRPNLFASYLQRDNLALMKAVTNNQFIRKIKLLPLGSDTENALVTENQTEEDCDITTEVNSEQDNVTNEAVVHKGAEAMTQKASQRPLLICPHGECPKSYTGGIGKVERLEKHIASLHSGCTECFDIVHVQYPQRELKQGQRHSCPVCGKNLAGSVTHINEHIKRVHNK